MRQATTAMQGVVRASKTIRRTFGAVSMQGAAYPAAASVPHPPPPLCPFPLGSTFAVTNSPTPHPVSRTHPFPFSYTASSATTPYRQPHALLHGSGAAATNTIALTPVPSFNIRRWLSQTPAVMKDKTVSEPTQRNTQSTATGDAAEGGAAAPTGATEEGSGAREGFVPSQAQVAAQVADLALVVEKLLLDQEKPSNITKETEQMSCEVERLNAAVLSLTAMLEKRDQQHLGGMGPEGESSTEALQEKMNDLDTLVRSTAANLNVWTKEQAGYEFFNEWTIPIVAILLIAFLLFRETLYKWFSKEAAAVASKTMEDEQLLNTVRQTIVNVAESPEASGAVATLLQTVLAMPETQRAVNNLVMQLVRDPYTTQIVSDYLVVPTLQYPSVQNQIFYSLNKASCDMMVTPWFVETAGNSMWESFVYGFTPRWPEWAVKVANLGMPKVLHNIRAAGAEEQEHAVDL